MLLFISFVLTTQGIGNTSQGAANCIMFVLCTRPIHERLCSALCCCSKCRADPQQSQDTPDKLSSGQDPPAKREEDSTSQNVAER